MNYRQTVLATPGLVVYYRLGVSGGPILYDQLGKHNGTLSGGYTAGVPGLVPGDPGETAIRFDGSSGQGALANGSALIAGGPMSIECWVSLPQDPANFGALWGVRQPGIGNIPDAFYLLQLQGSMNLECRFTNSAGTVYTTEGPPTPTPGVPHHLVMTYDGSSTLTVYLDGVATNTIAASGLLTDTTLALNIGTDSNNNYSGAVIDECAAYNACLPATTVLAHYQAGSAAAPAAVLPLAPVPSTYLPALGAPDLPQDLALVDGDIPLTPLGDYAVTFGGNKLVQDILLLAATPRGALTLDPLYGFGAAIGQPMPSLQQAQSYGADLASLVTELQTQRANAGITIAAGERLAALTVDAVRVDRGMGRILLSLTIHAGDGVSYPVSLPIVPGQQGVTP